MDEYWSWQEAAQEKKTAIISIGNFDGVHKGHQYLIKEMHRLAHPGDSIGIITFSNHPRMVLDPNFSPDFLTSLQLKLHLLSAEGVDFCHILHFDDNIRRMTAEEFIEKILQTYCLRAIVLGEDGVFGRAREGNCACVQKLGKEKGFAVYHLEKIREKSQEISSSQIKKSIKQGQLKEARELLGRPLTYLGKVIQGKQLGRKLVKVHTANIELTNLCIPPLGVYCARVYTEDAKVHPAIVNIGTAPSLQDQRDIQCEVHLLDGTFNLYEQALRIELHHFMRAEQKFNSTEELKVKVHKDIAFAKKFWQTKAL